MYEDYGLGGGDFAEDFGTSMTAGLTDIGLPTVGFAGMLGQEMAEYRLDKVIDSGPGATRWGGLLKSSGVEDMFGIRPGWRVGSKIGSLGGAGGFLGKAGGLLGGIGGVGMGLMMSMAPWMAIDAAVGYAQENITAGAESYFGANRMMNQLSGFAGSGFGGQSVMGGGMGEASVQSWASGAGASQLRNLGESTGMGINGVSQMAGHMTSQGLIDGFNSPEQFLKQFREKLQQVQQLSETLDVTLEEATKVMSTLNQAGISGDRQANLAGYAGTVSSLTGQSLSTVMNAGLSGSATATQMGLSADVGFETGASTLSSTSVLNRLGLLDERLVNRAGGVENLSSQMTNVSLQMSRSYGAQRLMSRMTNEEGSGFDPERMSEVLAGGRPGRRRLDPYAMADMQEDFQENQEALITGQINRLRARYDDDRDFNRAQYRFMAEMGINDPQMQQAYLQQMRAQPMMNMLEAAQAGRNRLQSYQQQGGDDQGIMGGIAEGLMGAVGVDMDSLSQDIDRYFGEPFRRFGERFAQTMEELGESIGEFFTGTSATRVDPLDLSVQDMEDYSLRRWQGNRTQAFTINELTDLRTDLGRQIQETDTRDLASRLGLSNSDDRQSAQILRQIEAGVLNAEDYGVGIWNAGDQPGITERIIASAVEIHNIAMGIGSTANREEHAQLFFGNRGGFDPSRAGMNLLNQDPVENAEGNDVYLTVEDMEGILVDSMTAGSSGNARDMRDWRRQMDVYGEDIISEVTTAYDRRGLSGARQTIGRRLGYLDDEMEGPRARQTINAVLAQTDAFSDMAAEANIQPGGGIQYEEALSARARELVLEHSQEWAGVRRRQSRRRDLGLADSYTGVSETGYGRMETREVFDEERNEEMAEALQGSESREYLEMMATMAEVGDITGADLGLISDRTRGETVGSNMPDWLGGGSMGSAATQDLAAFAASHTNDQAQTRMMALMFEEGEGDAQQQAMRFLFGGLNPTDENDVRRVRSFVAEQGLSDRVIREFENLGSAYEGEQTDWGRVVRRTRATGSRVVSRELDIAIGNNLDNALSLGTLHALEDTEITAAQARVFREQSAGIVSAIARNAGISSRREDGTIAAEEFGDANVRRLVDMMQRPGESAMAVSELREDQAHWGRIEDQIRRQVTSDVRRQRGFTSGEALPDEVQTEIDSLVSSQMEDRRGEVADDEGNLETGYAMYLVGARMGAGGLNAEEQAAVRALGSQGTELISLSEQLGEGDSQAIQNILSNSTFGRPAMESLARRFVEGSAGMDSEELMSGLSELLAGDTRAGESAFSDLVGNAISSGYMSTDLQRDKEEETRAREQAENLERIAVSNQVLLNAQTQGPMGFGLRAFVHQIED